MHSPTGEMHPICKKPPSSSPAGLQRRSRQNSEGAQHSTGCLSHRSEIEAGLKQQRHTAIREMLANTTVTSQDELRRKLQKRGFTVTQATLSRDMHELHIFKGANGYALAGPDDEDDAVPAIKETLENFGLEVKQAQNLLIVITTTGSAQPVAAALDYEDWPELMGSIAGDDTVLVICSDSAQAAVLKERMEGLIG